MKKIRENYKKIIDWLPNELAIIIILFCICGPLILIGFHSYHIGDINDAQLGYFGSIMGGGITLLGVIMTIDHNNSINKEQQKRYDSERKEELELMYQPILSANIVSDNSLYKLSSEIHLMFNHPCFNDTNLDTINQVIELKNVGRGEIKDINATIREVQDISNSNIDNCQLNLNNSYVLADGFFSFIPINDSNYIKLSIPISYNDFYDDYFIRIEVSLEITFNDFLNKNLYKYVLTFYLNIQQESISHYTYINDMTLMYSDKSSID